MLLALLAACACASGVAAHQLGGSAVPCVASAPPDHLIVYVSVGDSVVLHARPRGRVVARLGDRTGFGSPRAFGVVEIRNDRWLGVSVAGLGDHRLGWIDARAGGLRYARTRLEIDVELSARRLV